MFWNLGKAEDEDKNEGCDVEYVVDRFKVTKLVTEVGSLAGAGAGVGVGTEFGARSPTTDSAAAEIVGVGASEGVIVLP